MPLTVIRRSDTGSVTITGTLNLPDGTRRRIRARAQTDRLDLAREEAAALEGRLLRDAWHGKRRDTRSFAEATISYLDSGQRGERDRQLLHRILRAFGDLPLGGVNQEAVDRARHKMLRPDAQPSTVLRNLITPVRSVMGHAARRGWCDPVAFEIPTQPEGRTRFFRPDEAARLIEAAAPHLKPLFLFLIGTGARLSSALALEWRDVDLIGRRAILWRTKQRRRHVVELPTRLVAALASLSYRDGKVFRWETTPAHDRQPKRRSAYADRPSGGGQIKTGWKAALRRAGLDPDLTPHDLRHSWASWHYAIHKDLLALKAAGQWSTVTLCERYAHLMPANEEAAIAAFWYAADTATDRDRITA